MSDVVLITGSSRGIGAATALGAGRAGYKVCVHYREREDRAREVVDQIERSGSRAIAVGADLASEAEIVALFEAIDRDLGPLTALVNNAAILGGPQRRVEDTSWDGLQSLLTVNVAAPILCAREAVRRMARRHGGRGGVIVNVSSVAARLGSANEYVDYAASKGALDTFTLGLAREVAEDGIRVVGIRPGTTVTEIHASGGMPDRPDRVKGAIPLKRPAQPEEISHAILWLLSDTASYITGTTLDVAGGL